MNELSPEAKELLTIASGMDDPSGDDRARVRRALMAAVAATAATAVSGASAVAAGVSGAAGGTSTAAGSAALGAASGAASAGATSAGAAASVGAAAGGGAIASGAIASGAFGVKVLALLVTVGAGTAVVIQPWRADSFESSTVEAREERREQTESSSRPAVQSAAADTAEPIAPVEPLELVEELVEAPVEPVEGPVVAAVDGVVPSTNDHTASRRAERAQPIEARDPREVASVDTLAAELALLRRARAALAAGELDRASAALAEHESSFANGVLRAEREGTRALVRCAERPEPEVARGFAQLHPGSPLLARVRAACDGSP